MKKILFGTVAAIGLSLAIAGGASADGQGKQIGEICDATNNLGQKNKGQCVKLATGNIPQVCKDLLATLPAGVFESVFGRENIGACVSFIRDSQHGG